MKKLCIGFAFGFVALLLMAAMPTTINTNQFGPGGQLFLLGQLGTNSSVRSNLYVTGTNFAKDFLASNSITLGGQLTATGGVAAYDPIIARTDAAVWGTLSANTATLSNLTAWNNAYAKSNIFGAATNFMKDGWASNTFKVIGTLSANTAILTNGTVSTLRFTNSTAGQATVAFIRDDGSFILSNSLSGVVMEFDVSGQVTFNSRVSGSDPSNADQFVTKSYADNHYVFDATDLSEATNWLFQFKQPTNANLTAWSGISTNGGANADILGAGTIAAARMPAFTGDATTVAGATAVTIANDAVTYAKMQNVSAASKLLGRGDSGSGDPQEITLGTGLSMSGTTLNGTALGKTNLISINTVGVGQAILTNSGDFTIHQSFVPAKTYIFNLGDSIGDAAGEYFNLFTNMVGWTGFALASNCAVAGNFLSAITNQFTNVVNNLPAAGSGTNVIVILEAGANYNVGSTPVPTYITILSNFVRMVEASNCIPVVFTIMPNTIPISESLETNYAQINDWILNTSRAYFTNLYVVDVRRLLPNNADTRFFNADGLHLVSGGSQLVANEIDRVLREGPRNWTRSFVPYNFLPAGNNSVMRDTNGNNLAQFRSDGSFTVATITNTTLLSGATITSTNLVVSGTGGNGSNILDNIVVTNLASIPTNYAVFTFTNRGELSITNSNRRGEALFKLAINLVSGGKPIFTVIATNTASTNDFGPLSWPAGVATESFTNLVRFPLQPNDIIRIVDVSTGGASVTCVTNFLKNE